MSEINEKRPRCSNFSASEMEVLLELVEQHRTIIECKKTDAVSNREKEDEWEKLTEKFNAVAGTGRQSKQLRSKWDSLKKNTRKKYGAEKNNLYKTGGGPGGGIILSSWENKILAIIGISATGFASTFDSDYIGTNEGNAEETLQYSEEIVSNEDITIELDDPSVEVVWEQMDNDPEPTHDYVSPMVNVICDSDKNQWKQWSPAQLKRPMHRALQYDAANVTKTENSEGGLTDNATVLVMNPLDKILKSSENLERKSPAKRKRTVGKVQSGEAPTKIQKERYEMLLDKKLELVSLQIEIQRKEHEERERRSREKHEIEMLILKKELQSTCSCNKK